MSGARFEDWPERLFDYLESVRSKPFKYGENDCCLFVANAVEAMTGIDPAEEFRGYDEDGAKEILSRFGGLEGLAEYVCEKSGFPEVPVSMAQRGDVVLAKDMLGICLGRRVAAPGKSGVVYLPRTFDRAWRV